MEMPCAAGPVTTACPAPLELPPAPAKPEPPKPPEPPEPPEPAPEPEPGHQDQIAEEEEEEQVAEEAEPAPDTPAEEPSSPRNAERLADLEELFGEIMADPEPAAFEGEEARPITAIKLEGAPMMVLSIRDHASVASDYVRVMNVATFVEDPEELEPFVRRIIVCPAPELDEYLTVPRATVAKRLKQAGVPLDRVVMTGAREILIMRTKAQGSDEVEPEESLGDDEATAAVRKDASVLIVREGSFFQIEERGTAKADGAVGEVIDITDRKGRDFRALITGEGTVKPVEEKQ
jgi:hypothetical protein